MSDDAQKIKAILGEFILKNALSDGIDTARIQENWSSIMGENISAYTKEVSLQQDVLIVKLSSSVLRQELSYGKEKIVEMINKSLGKQDSGHSIYLIDFTLREMKCTLNYCIFITIRTMNCISTNRLCKQLTNRSFGCLFRVG